MDLTEALKSTTARFLYSCGATLGGAALTVVTNDPAYISLATTGSVITSLGTGVLATEMRDLCVKTTAKNKDLYRNHHIQRLVGEVIEHCVLLASQAKHEKQYRRLASLVIDGWERLADHPMLEAATEQLQNSKILDLFVMELSELPRRCPVKKEEWETIIEFILEFKKQSVSDSVVERSATKLEELFHKKLFEIAKDKFAKQEEAYAAIQLRLMGDLLNSSRKSLATADSNLKETKKLRKSHQAIARIVVKNFRNIESSIDYAALELDRRAKERSAQILEDINAGLIALKMSLSAEIVGVEQSLQMEIRESKKEILEGFQRVVSAQEARDRYRDVPLDELPESLKDSSSEEILNACMLVMQTEHSEELPESSLAANILRGLPDRLSHRYLVPEIHDVDGRVESLDNFLQPGAKKLLVGNSGMGKSTFLRYLGCHAIHSGLLPVTVDLREYEIPIDDSTQEPWDYTARKLQNLLREFGCDPDGCSLKACVAKWAEQGKLLIAIDSIDETQTDTFLRYLEERIGEAKSPVVITCRFQDFRQILVELGFEEVFMRRNEQHFYEFVEAALPYISEPDRRKLVQHELAETPMGLQLLVRGYRFGAVPNWTDAEKEQFLKRLKEESSTNHIKAVVDFLISPESEAEGLCRCPSEVRQLSQVNLYYVCQVLALHYLHQVDTEEKLTYQNAIELVQACVVDLGVTCDAKKVVGYLSDRKLIQFGFENDLWFLHDFLAQSLANSSKNSPVVHRSTTFEIGAIKKRMTDMQGREIQNMRAHFFQQTHRGGIKDILGQLAELPSFKLNGREDVLHKMNQGIDSTTSLEHYQSAMMLALKVFRQKYSKAESDQDRFLAMEVALEKLLKLVQSLPQKGSPVVDYEEERPRRVLLIEYLLGLGFFEVISVLGELFLRSRGYQNGLSYPEEFDYVAGLELAFESQASVLEEIESLVGGPPEETWVELAEYYLRLPESLKAVLDRAIGLRYIPRMSALMSIAQMIHWDGWGGNGQTCDLVFRHQDDPLSQLLARRQRHAIDWHGVGQAKDGNLETEPQNFSVRHRMFSSTASILKDYTAFCGAAILTAKNLGQGNNRFRIWGDAVGPTFKAERDLVQAIRQCCPRDANPKFELALTEMSGPSLDRLFDSIEHKEDLDCYSKFTVYYRDLNLGFPGEPDYRTSENLQHYSQFDAYSCAIALHQVADQKLGHDRIREIMGFANHVVRPGGVISVPDVGCGVNLQAFLIPINLVDREGGWGLDVFSVTDTHRALCTFRDVADFTTYHDDGKVKIPLPLVEFATGTPLRCGKMGFAMYESISYLVVEIPEKQLDEFQMRWDSAQSIEDLIAIAEDGVQLWRPQAVGWNQEVRDILELHDKSRYICPEIYRSRFGVEQQGAVS